MKNIRLQIEYDGTNYKGWQAQKNGLAIQTVVESAIYKTTGEQVNLIGSGRTDAGVHARAQTANFFSETRIPAEKIMFPLNNHLPKDIVVKHSDEVSPNFHSRFSATGKEYRYLIRNSRKPSALMVNRSMQIPYSLDIELMNKAAEIFIGEHDFTGYRAAGSDIKSTIRTVYSSGFEIIHEDEDERLIVYKIAGNGFLYNMVRIIVGTLLEIGYGRISAETALAALTTMNRSLAGRTAVAQGLYLYEVFYPLSDLSVKKTAENDRNIE